MEHGTKNCFMFYVMRFMNKNIHQESPSGWIILALSQAKPERSKIGLS
jgi:hypothetical protein